MRVLIIGDMQLKLSSLAQGEEVLKRCRALAVDCQLTVFMGDQYDSKAIIRTEIQNLYLRYLKEWPTEVYMLVGNHDYTNVNLTEHSLEPFKYMKNIIVVDQPTQWCLEDNDFVFYPYMKADEFINKISDVSSSAIIFAHQGINGFLYSNGVAEESPIQYSHVSDFKKCFLGHIHKPQQKENVIYVGSPFTQNFGEANEEKRVILYDTNTNIIEPINLGLPQHMKFTYTIESLEKVKEIRQQLKRLANHILMLTIQVPLEIADKIEKKSFKLDNLQVFKKEIILPVKELQIEDTLSADIMADKYIDMIDTSLDKEELKKLNREILSKCV